MTRVPRLLAGIAGVAAIGALAFAAGLHASRTGAIRPRAKPFAPPAFSSIPDSPFGKQVALGRAIFDDPQAYAASYVGDDLKCSNCHLGEGRLANSAPMWAAWVRYPQYRKKNGHVNTFAERLQGCFRYSENGKAPPLGDPVLVALESYAYFLAEGAPVGAKMPGAGYPKLARPGLAPDFARGKALYAADCALCHGADGAGRQARGQQVFPPLWGARSFNWGAGMAQLDNAAAFIKANMPLGKGGSLSDQQAWDLAAYIDSQVRPQDPRFTGDIAETRRRFHDTPNSMYGETVDGVLLGEGRPTGPG